MSVPLVVVIIVIRLVFRRRDDRTLVGIDPNIEDLTSSRLVLRLWVVNFEFTNG